MQSGLRPGWPKSAAGAVAFSRTADPDIGEYSDAVVLAAHGRLPMMWPRSFRLDENGVVTLSSHDYLPTKILFRREFVSCRGHGNRIVAFSGQ